MDKSPHLNSLIICWSLARLFAIRTGLYACMAITVSGTLWMYTPSQGDWELIEALPTLCLVPHSPTSLADHEKPWQCTQQSIMASLTTRWLMLKTDHQVDHVYSWPLEVRPGHWFIQMVDIWVWNGTTLFTSTGMYMMEPLPPPDVWRNTNGPSPCSQPSYLWRLHSLTDSTRNLCLDALWCKH